MNLYFVEDVSVAEDIFLPSRRVQRGVICVQYAIQGKVSSCFARLYFRAIDAMLKK